METCTALASALAKTTESAQEENAESEIGYSKEAVVVASESENLIITTLSKSMSEAVTASHDTAERAVGAQSEVNDSVANSHGAPNDNYLTINYLNEIAKDDKVVELVTTEPCEFMKRLGIVQFEEDGKSFPCEHLNEMVVENRVEIDTASPFESVKQAVNMFGGVADWKAQRISAMEKRQFVAAELQKAGEELAELKRLLVVAEGEKLRVLQQTDKTKKLIQELRLDLERVQASGEQATQGSEFANQGIEERAMGVADEESVAWKTQLEVAKGQYASVVADMQIVNQEFERANLEYQSLIKLRDIAVQNAEDALLVSQETQKTVEELTQELITTKNSLDIARATHLIAEKQRTAVVAAKYQESEERQKEIKHANQEVEGLNHEVALVRDLILKLETSSTLLQNLKMELEAVRASEFELGAELAEAEDGLWKAMDQLELAKIGGVKAVASRISTMVEQEETKVNLNKATGDMRYLAITTESLRKGLERESAVLEKTQERVGKTCAAVASLEAELNQITEELQSVLDGERKAKETMEELSRALRQAAAEADEAKSVAEVARVNMRKSNEETEQARAATSTAESRLQAAIKMAEAAQASKAIALAEIKALNESDLTVRSSKATTSAGVTLSFKEYYALSRQAHHAEELANERVAAAMAQIDAAKDSQEEVLRSLDEANKEIKERREALQAALQKAEAANAAKLVVEDDLRKWRAEHEHHRKVGDIATIVKNPGVSRGPFSNGKNITFSDKKDLHSISKQDGVPTKPMASLGQVLGMKVSSLQKVQDEEPSNNEVASRRKSSHLPHFALFMVRKKKSY
eukprot:Gb_36825 [translate_table: standard]